jgi:hypothetical protein
VKVSSPQQRRIITETSPMQVVLRTLHLLSARLQESGTDDGSLRFMMESACELLKSFQKIDDQYDAEELLIAYSQQICSFAREKLSLDSVEICVISPAVEKVIGSDLLGMIFSFVRQENLLNLTTISKRFNHCANKEIWRVVTLTVDSQCRVLSKRLGNSCLIPSFPSMTGLAFVEDLTNRFVVNTIPLHQVVTLLSNIKSLKKWTVYVPSSDWDDGFADFVESTIRSFAFNLKSLAIPNYEMRMLIERDSFRSLLSSLTNLEHYSFFRKRPLVTQTNMSSFLNSALLILPTSITSLLYSSHVWTTIDFSTMKRFSLRKLELKDTLITKETVNSFLDLVISLQELDMKDVDLENFERNTLSKNILEYFNFQPYPTFALESRNSIDFFFSEYTYAHLKHLILASDSSENIRFVLSKTPNLRMLEIRCSTLFFGIAAMEFLNHPNCPDLPKLNSFKIEKIDGSKLHDLANREDIYRVLKEKFPCLQIIDIIGPELVSSHFLPPGDSNQTTRNFKDRLQRLKRKFIPEQHEVEGADGRDSSSKKRRRVE